MKGFKGFDKDLKCTCSFCLADDFLDRRELTEHQEEEHPYELHDKNCSVYDVKYESRLGVCQNCGVEFSED